MKITTDKAVATVLRTVKITDGQPVISDHGYARPMIVDTVVIRYTWCDGRFEVDSRFSGIKLYGHWLKKDGQPSKVEADIRAGYESYSSWALRPEYQFLGAIVDLLRPSPDLSMTIANDAEVG